MNKKTSKIIKEACMSKLLKLLVAIGIFANVVFADVDVNVTNFPDNNFRAYVSGLVSGRSVITDAEISAVNKMELYNKSIGDLTGIKYFTQLDTLSCGSNNLTSLNLSENTKLRFLSCSYNQLQSLDLSNNTALTYLSAGNNQFNSIDVSNNKELTGLYLPNCNLTSLVGLKNTKLTELVCVNNKLQSLDLSNITTLTSVWCLNNKLTSLNVSGSTLLSTLDCSNNQLTSLNVSGNTALTYLDCSTNKLTSLDLSKNTFLTTFYGSSQYLELTLLGLGNWYSLEYSMKNPTIFNGWSQHGNPLDVLAPWEFIKYVDGKVVYNKSLGDNGKGGLYTYLGFRSETGLTDKLLKGIVDISFDNLPVTSGAIEISKDNFPDDIFRAWILEQPWGSDGILTQEEIETIKSIDVSGTKYVNGGIEDLTGIEFFTELEYLNASYNRLEDIDVSKNTALKYLDVTYNYLAELDVSDLLVLETLRCGWNVLTELDVSNNLELTKLNAPFNHLSELDVSNNLDLTSLIVSGNKLSFIDLSENTLLTDFMGEGQNVQVKLENKGNGNYSAPIVLDNPEFVNLGIGYTDGKITSNSSSIASTGFSAETGIGGYSLSGTMNLTYLGVGDVLINAENFPDDNFREHLLNYAWGKDSVITAQELATIKDMSAKGKEIADLTGIEFFTELTFLDVTGNNLPELDVSDLSKLETLRCGSNELKELDLSGNPALKNLDVLDNLLTSLNISENYELEYLNCHTNQLKELDVSSNTNLVGLNCHTNYLTELDVTNNEKLKDLQCQVNELTSLDLSKNSDLTNLIAVQQNATITLYVEDDNYGNFIALNNPDQTKFVSGITYANGKLTSNSNGIASTPFSVETGIAGKSLSGTLNIVYSNIILHDCDFSVAGTVIDQGNCEEGIKQTCKAKCSICGIESETEVVEVDCPVSIIPNQNNDSNYGVKFAKNIVSDKAVINVVAPEKAVETKVVVYDAIGNIVFNASVRGDEEITWNLKNNSGRFVANGGYLVIAEVKGINNKVYPFSAKLGVNR